MPPVNHQQKSSCKASQISNTPNFTDPWKSGILNAVGRLPKKCSNHLQKVVYWEWHGKTPINGQKKSWVTRVISPLFQWCYGGAVLLGWFFLGQPCTPPVLQPTKQPPPSTSSFVSPWPPCDEANLVTRTELAPVRFFQLQAGELGGVYWWFPFPNGSKPPTPNH